MSEDGEVTNPLTPSEDTGTEVPVGPAKRKRLDKAHGVALASSLRPKQNGAGLAWIADPAAPTTVLARIGGYTEASAHNARANGIVPREFARTILAEQRASGGLATQKTLRSLRPKAIEALDRSLTLQEGERPDTGHLQAAGLALKLAQEAGEEDDGLEAQRSATYYARRDRRRALRAWQMGVRFMLAHGADAALERAQELAAQIEVDTPYLDALLPPRPPHGPLQKVFQRRGQ